MVHADRTMSKTSPSSTGREAVGGYIQPFSEMFPPENGKISAVYSEIWFPLGRKSNPGIRSWMASATSAVAYALRKERPGSLRPGSVFQPLDGSGFPV